MKDGTRIHIGTSGWHYDHWLNTFYPAHTSAQDFLSCYAETFHTVEINNSFYRLPDKKTFRDWRTTVEARRFIFAVKASRYITHMKKLKDPEDAVNRFIDHVKELNRSLGPILFQLPPSWRCNPERLESFLKLLPQEFRYAFEFRDPSWFDSSVYDILKAHGAAFCIYDLAGTLSPKITTADFVYVRLHGPGGSYEGKYDVRTLSGWAGAFSSWARQGKEIYCYFDNDQHGYAPQNAERLQDMISIQKSKKNKR